MAGLWLRSAKRTVAIALPSKISSRALTSEASFLANVNVIDWRTHSGAPNDGTALSQANGIHPANNAAINGTAERRNEAGYTVASYQLNANNSNLPSSRGPAQRKILAAKMANGYAMVNGRPGVQNVQNGDCGRGGIAAKRCENVDLILVVRLLMGETRVGFSMCGGRDESLPSMINNILPGSPADRAGLSIGDEIIEVNGVSVERATHAEIVQHIHRCIKSRTIQLRVRRKQDEDHPEQHSNTSTTRVTDAYLISVNDQQKMEVADAIQVKYPGTNTYDMENVHTRLESGEEPLPIPVSGSQSLKVRNGDIHHVTNGTNEESTSTPHTVAQMYFGYDNQPKISPRDHNQNSASFKAELQHPAVHQTVVYANSVELQDFNSAKVDRVSPPLLQPETSNSIRIGDSPPPIPASPPPVIGSSPDENERLRNYEEELKKRKEREERIAKEQAFLRSSLRGSKKLQALEKSTAATGAVGIQNAAYDAEDESKLVNEKENEHPVALQDVLVSVNQVTKALDKFPEHRRDSEFLRRLFSEQEVQNAIEVTAAVQKYWCSKPSTDPITGDAFQDSDAVLKQLGDSISDPAAELQEILEKPHLQAALYTHDRLAGKVYDSECPSTSNGSVVGLKETKLDDLEDSGNLRIIKLIKMDDHYLGATVKNDGDRIVIGRIVKGGVAEKTKLLHENDEILEVNGVDLRGKSVNDVCDLLRNMTGEISFIVNPASDDETQPDAPSIAPSTGTNGVSNNPPMVRHMRSLYDYDPEDDFYVPCRELALKFQKGDILHVLSMADEQWWQAFREGDDPNQQTLAGLIPSSSFQTQRELYRRELLGEGRKSRLNNSDTDKSLFCARRPKKQKNKSGKVTHLGSSNPAPGTNLQNGTLITDSILENGEEEEEILTYEEVALFLSRTGRKRPVVLVGPPKVGCLELRARLMETDKEKFAGVVPHTSRTRNQAKEVDGVHYYFVTKQKFQDDVNGGKFVEWGEFQKNYYGTSFQAIQRVVDRGKTCILALQAQSLKTLRDSDLMPYVVFISPPSLERLKMNRLKLQKGDKNYMKDEELRSIIYEGKRMEEDFGHLFDKVIVNMDLDRSFQELRNTIHRLETEPHWVPSYWLAYDQNTTGSTKTS